MIITRTVMRMTKMMMMMTSGFMDMEEGSGPYSGAPEACSGWN